MISDGGANKVTNFWSTSTTICCDLVWKFTDKNILLKDFKNLLKELWCRWNEKLQYLALNLFSGKIKMIPLTLHCLKYIIKSTQANTGWLYFINSVFVWQVSFSILNSLDKLLNIFRGHSVANSGFPRRVAPILEMGCQLGQFSQNCIITQKNVPKCF